MRFIVLPLILTLVGSLLAGCNASEAQNPADATLSTQEALAAIARKRIFFGHQSVGQNIMEGLQGLCRTDSTVTLAETSDPAAFDRPVFAHARVGKNGSPSSKLSDFERLVNGGIGDRADIAMLKLCYVDVTAKTDVKQLFQEYQETMSRLRNRYPKLSIVHVSVPLRTVGKGIKATIKTMAGLGRPAEYDNNIKRNFFNALLRQRYQGKEPVFDLASLESTAPNGERESFSVAGRSYQALFPPYSNDGGHLAPLGRKRAAEGLLLTLASVH